MYINPDELDEELALEKLSLKRANSKKPKRRKNEHSTSKRKDRARTKRRDEISIGCSRGRRKRFLSAFGARPSMAGGRGISPSTHTQKGKTGQQFHRPKRRLD